MIPLIDADILLHEIGHSAEFKDKETGEPVLLSFEEVERLLNDKIALICEDVNATEPPIIFISNSDWFSTARLGYVDVPEYVPTFRYEVAKTKPYKGNRKNPKPYHFYNILVYLLTNYHCVISRGGLEADDELCIYQNGREDTIICSRDKDLRICPGWHFSWECGSQRAIGPTKTDALGWLEVRDNGETLGYGLAFFYYQMLVGDSADNIPGLPGCGPAAAKKLLTDCKSERDYFQAVKKAYKDKLGDGAKDYFLEQANLLWMIRERGKGYEIPSDR